MARYLGPKAKLARREGTDLFLKSARRAISDKAKFDSKPGQHGRTSGSRTSDFGLQLREKQKVKRIYGLMERQFRITFDRAARMKGIKGENLLLLLERRLDNMVYRMGFARTRREARQLVHHGHFRVNGKRLNVPSAVLRVGDVVQVRERSRKMASLADSLDAVERRGLPAWIELDRKEMKATVKAFPSREDITMPIQEQMIVELYSK